MSMHFRVATLLRVPWTLKSARGLRKSAMRRVVQMRISVDLVTLFARPRIRDRQFPYLRSLSAATCLSVLSTASWASGLVQGAPQRAATAHSVLCARLL